MMRKLILSFLIFVPAEIAWGQEWYKASPDTETRWTSFENPAGEKGRGGRENQGAKGHPMDVIAPGESKILMNATGSGIIQRMWLTIDDRSPAMLRSLRFEIFWDGEARPAVSAPLGDFFGLALGRRAPFETALFSDPEGRSFNCVIPMPFRKGARVVLSNESEKKVTLFYDINYQQVKSLPSDAMYFHAYWNRVRPTPLGKDYEILPPVKGTGRFLGMNMGIITGEEYGKSWWGEGEVKIYLNGDTNFPTLNGTGTEDYIGTAWGQGVFNHLYQGCLVADQERRQWAFYRYHIPDPVYFKTDCRVTIQIMGGDSRDNVRNYVQQGAKLVPVTVSGAQFVKLLDLPSPPTLMSENFPDGWTNFYRQDDVSSTAYFYVDSPVSALPLLPSKEARTAGLPEQY